MAERTITCGECEGSRTGADGEECKHCNGSGSVVIKTVE